MIGVASRLPEVPMSSPPGRSLSIATRLAYGAPIFAIAYPLFFLQFYFLKFATDVLLLSPALVGALFALARVWDAVNGPLVGSFSDRSRSRLGRRRPFLLAALPLLTLASIALWSVPHGITGSLEVAWIAASLFLFFTAFDLYTLPHFALGAELSRDSHERTQLFAVRQISFTIGILLAFVAIQRAMNAADPRGAVAEIALPAAIASALLLAIPPLFLREPHAGRVAGGRGIASAFRDVVATRTARLLLLVWFLENAAFGAVGTMGPYLAQYVLHRPDLVGVLSGAYVIAGVLSIPLWVRIARSAGRRDTWLAAMVLAALAFGGLWFVRPADVRLTVVLLALAGSATGCGGVLSSALLADVIDADEQRTGERKEGVYSAAMTLVLKLGTSLSTAASGVVLTAMGFAPNVEQSAESLLGIRFLFAGLPFLGFVAGILVFRSFPRDGATAMVPGPALRAPSAP